MLNKSVYTLTNYFALSIWQGTWHAPSISVFTWLQLSILQNLFWLQYMLNQNLVDFEYYIQIKGDVLFNMRI